MTLLYDAAAATGILDALPATAEEAASARGMDVHGVRVVLDALAAWELVERSADRTYALGPGAPGGDDQKSLSHHARAVRRWASTIDRRVRGEAVEDGADRPKPEAFLDALAVTARKSAAEVVEACLARFPNAGSVLDLGGGHGEYSLEFARRGLRATMQDMPAMVDVVRRQGRLAEAGVGLFEGSFFEAVPEGPFDLAFCSGVCETFDGERNVMLYRRLRPVVAPGGGIAVVTFLRRRNPQTALFAVQMLVNAHGGDTHAEDEYRRWLAQAGFEIDAAVVDLAGQARSVLFAT